MYYSNYLFQGFQKLLHRTNLRRNALVNGVVHGPVYFLHLLRLVRVLHVLNEPVPNLLIKQGLLTSSTSLSLLKHGEKLIVSTCQLCSSSTSVIVYNFPPSFST